METKNSVSLSRLSEFKPSANLLRTGKPLHESHDIIKGVYFDALFLTNGNLATLLNSHEHGEGRCPHDVITASRLMLWRKRVFIISVWVLCSLVQLFRACKSLRLWDEHLV